MVKFETCVRVTGKSNRIGTAPQRKIIPVKGVYPYDITYRDRAKRYLTALTAVESSCPKVYFGTLFGGNSMNNKGVAGLRKIFSSQQMMKMWI